MFCCLGVQYCIYLSLCGEWRVCVWIEAFFWFFVSFRDDEKFDNISHVHQLYASALRRYKDYLMGSRFVAPLSHEDWSGQVIRVQ